MSLLEVLLLLIALIGLGASIFFWTLLKRMDGVRAEMENYLYDLNETIGNFRLKIDSLFSMNIHYYDDTIYQFIEDTKEVKLEIDKVMEQYEALKPFIFPEPLPPEEQEKELLGVMKAPIYPGTRAPQ